MVFCGFSVNQYFGWKLHTNFRIISEVITHLKLIILELIILLSILSLHHNHTHSANRWHCSFVLVAPNSCLLLVRSDECATIRTRMVCISAGIHAVWDACAWPASVIDRKNDQINSRTILNNTRYIKARNPTNWTFFLEMDFENEIRGHLVILTGSSITIRPSNGSWLWLRSSNW